MLIPVSNDRQRGKKGRKKTLCKNSTLHHMTSGNECRCSVHNSVLLPISWMGTAAYAYIHQPVHQPTGLWHNPCKAMNLTWMRLCHGRALPGRQPWARAEPQLEPGNLPRHTANLAAARLSRPRHSTRPWSANSWAMSSTIRARPSLLMMVSGAAPSLRECVRVRFFLCSLCACTHV